MQKALLIICLLAYPQFSFSSDLTEKRCFEWLKTVHNGNLIILNPEDRGETRASFSSAGVDVVVEYGDNGTETSIDFRNASRPNFEFKSVYADSDTLFEMYALHLEDLLPRFEETIPLVTDLPFERRGYVMLPINRSKQGEIQLCTLDSLVDTAIPLGGEIVSNYLGVRRGRKPKFAFLVKGADRKTRVVTYQFSLSEDGLRLNHEKTMDYNLGSGEFYLFVSDYESETMGVVDKRNNKAVYIENDKVIARLRKEK